MKQLTARPQGHDYMIEVAARFGRNHLCNLAALGTSSTDQRKPYDVVEGVAVVYITGVLCNDAWYWDETEYGQIQREVEMATEDAAVKSTLLIIDSPGGETTMAFETADKLAECAKKKPMWAVAAPHAYSAAYLMAAQAERIYTPPKTGGVGSVGVYSMHVDYSGALEQNGIKVTFITAGKGKVEGNPYEPLSDSAHKKIQAEVNRLYEMFIASVSAGRSLTSEAIKKLGAVTLHGGEAIAVGLADALGTYDDAWLELASKSQMTFAMSASAGGNSTKEAHHMAEPNTPADPKQPEQAAGAAVNTSAGTSKLVADAKAAGFAEAGEIADLCALAGEPTKVRGYLAEVRGGKKTVANVREELLEARAKAGEEGGEISNASLPGTAASKDEKPKQSTAERMKAKFGKGAV